MTMDMFSQGEDGTEPIGSVETFGQYAQVNGLNIYYEVHGTGAPLVLLHGGFMTIDTLGPILPALARNHQVIAVELEGHGRTADLDRPLSIDQMSEDIAGLLKQLGLGPVNLVGFSMGGSTALRLTMLHPEVVRRLVVISAHHRPEGTYSTISSSWPNMTAHAFAGTPMEQEYKQKAPDPEHWPVFVDKMRESITQFKGWSESEVKSIKAPTLLVVGDSDIIRLESAVEMFRLLGGGREESIWGTPAINQLAVLPGANHYNIIDHLDQLLPLVVPFLDAPDP